MKNTILILLFFFFSFSLGSTENQQNLTLENNSAVGKVMVKHFLGTTNGVKQYIDLEIPLVALPAHLAHGDSTGGCLPPDCVGG